MEKPARRVIGWGMGRWLRPDTYPEEARRGPLVTVADEYGWPTAPADRAGGP